MTLGQLHQLKSTLCSDTRSDQNHQEYWTHRWIQELETQILSHKDGLPSDPRPVSLPRFYSKLGIQRQGPFLLPNADSADTRIPKDALGIFEEAHFLWLAFDDASLDLLVNLEPPKPVWDLKGPGLLSDSQSLLLLERSYLLDDAHSASSTFTPRLVADPKYDYLVYCYHEQGVHKVSFRAAKECISKIILNQASEALPAQSCQVEWLVSTLLPKDSAGKRQDILGLSPLQSSKRSRHWIRHLGRYLFGLLLPAKYALGALPFRTFAHVFQGT